MPDTWPEKESPEAKEATKRIIEDAIAGKDEVPSPAAVADVMEDLGIKEDRHSDVDEETEADPHLLTGEHRAQVVAQLEEEWRFRNAVLRGDLVRQRIMGNMTAKEVGESMGYPTKVIRQFEDGQRDVHMSFLRRYCLAIGVLLDWEVMVHKNDRRASATNIL